MADVLPVFFGLALLLGFKHSYDADHLVAVSNLLVRSPSTRSTARLSTSWAAGHMLTASIITIALYLSGQTVLNALLDNLQFSVAIMLIVIGVLGIVSETSYYHEHVHRHLFREHSHAHSHTSLRSTIGRFIRSSRTLTEQDDTNGHVSAEPHKTMFGIGIVHGLASNDELLILFTISLSVTSLLGLLLGVGVFSMGVVLGMVVYGIGVTYPIARFGKSRVRKTVNISVAVLSIAYAVLLLAGFETVNPLAGLIG
ncbi:MAG TPA: hypothetical protein VIH34_01220 [Candidatus Bathyarchaeia archaeon]